MLTATRTETGLRPDNEDYIKTLKVGPYKLYVIADGMGGENCGEVASKLAAETLCEVVSDALKDSASLTDDTAKVIFTDAYQAANKAILRYCADSGLRDSDMGTTLTAVLVRERKMYVAHIGDTRVYLKHGSAMTRLTSDHISPNNSDELVKYLGINTFIYPDFNSYNIMYGDLIVLCTDGIYKVLSDKEIVDCIKLHNKLEECMDKLFDSAYKAGSTDNMSVILANIRPE